MWEKAANLMKTMFARLTFRGEPSPECWVFSSVHNRTFNYNSSYLFLYVKEHCPEIHPYYVMNDDKKREELGEKYGKEYFLDGKTMAGIRKILSCKVWFTSTAPPLYGVGFRKKYVILNLWHGIPLKKIGMEQKNLSWFTRKYYKYLFADNYEGVVTTSSHLVHIMSRSFLVEPERIKVWGQPRNDVLFSSNSEGKGLEEVFSGELPPYEKVVLYAPTFRDHEPTQLFPFQDMDRERLCQWLEEKKIFLCIRLHLYDQTGYQWIQELDRTGSRIRFLNEDRTVDIMEALKEFDLLITDYSSIYMDYLLTGKPVLFLPYDQEAYLKERGMNFPYDQVTPGPKPKTFQEFLNSMEDLLYNHDGYVRQRESVNNFLNEIQRPCCADICKYTRELLDWRE
ncbi:MAG: CDP-glycerol glycerophosphotransferase family protein [Ruminococcus sp.]